jgi:hypothetical protein
MSNQIVISSGAKVRNLDGVLTGTSGIVSSVPLGAANGVATLDSGGKVPVSQLPSSVVTYLGTWNAATNTPTLVNGTGDAGDMYICNVAGTVNFGAGPVTFAVGDWVLYGSGTWQKSNGQNGTVTSVGVSRDGDALSITGSPITTAGTINIGFTGSNAQYINGEGDLVTFPSLTGFVTDVTGTAPIVSSGGTTPAISIPAASSTVDGYLDNADWTTFNNKQNAITLTTTGTSGVSTLIGSTLNIPNYSTDLSGYVPYTGATANVNLGTFDLTADVITGATGSFASNGGSNTFAINHSSGSGIALNITKGGSGEGLYINKTSGSGNAATIIGTLNATTLVKSGGTSSQFLKADGSVDSSAYITLTSLSGGTGISYNNTTGVITNSAPDQTVSLTAGDGISISGTYPSFTIASTITQYTDALARASISLTTTGTSGAATYNSTTGVFNIPQYQSVLTNPVTGTGTTNNLPKFTGASTIGNANITDNGSVITANASGTYTMGLRVYNDIATYNSINFTDASYVVQGRIVGSSNSLGFDVNGTALRALNISSNGTSTFNNSVNLSAIFTNAGAEGNYNAIELRGGTGGTAPNWQISKDNTVSNAFQITASTLNGGTTYTTPVFTLINTGSLSITNTFTAITELRLKSAVYPTSYNSSLRSDSSARGILQFGNNEANYILAGNTATGGWLAIRVNVSEESISSGTEAIRFNSNGNIGINSSVDAGFKLDVNGTGRFQGALSGTSATFSGNVSINANSARLTVSESGGAEVRVTAGGSSGFIGTYSNHSLTFLTNSTTALSLASNGAATFSSSIAAASLSTTTNIQTTTSGGGYYLVGGIPAIRYSYFGYSAGYEGVLIGSTSARSLFFNVDISGNPSGAFNGGGQEYVWRNAGSFITPNSINNGYNTLFGWNSSGQVTFAGTTFIGSSVTGGGALQVNGNVNINGVFQINGVTIGGGGGSGVTGSGTTNYMTKWTGSTTLGNSVIYDTGTNVVIGGTTANRKLEVITGSGVDNGIRLTYANGVISEGMDITYNNTGATTTRFDSIYVSDDALMQFRMKTNGTATTPLALWGNGRAVVGSTTRISVATLSVFSGGAAGVAWGSGLNIGDASNYMGFIQDAGLSAFRNFGAGGFGFFNDATAGIIYFKNNGNITIGTATDNGYKLQINGSASFAYGFLSVYRGSSSPNDILVGNSGSTFYVGGSVTATGGFFDTSDSRLKILVKDYEQPKGIENVAARMYVKNNRKELGYYAQDLQEILPSAVSEGSDGFLTLSYSQVHTAKIAHLEKEIAELKELIKQLL